MTGRRGLRVGPYDLLYERAPGHVLWGQNPGRLVKRVAEFSPPGSVLDAGCGDGKNALFLERHGCSVTGVDISALALQGLGRRFRIAGYQPAGRYFLANLCEPLPPVLESFDLLVSYGLFHCLSPGRRIHAHQQLQRRVRPGGIMLLTTLVEGCNLPAGHQTPEVRLAVESEVNALLAGWVVLEWSVGSISEAHPPLVADHQHNAVWVVAKRPL